MRRSTFRIVAGWIISALALSLVDAIGGGLRAQGSTSAAIGGRILDGQGRGLAGVEVLVTNTATGFSTRVASRAAGRYVASGLEVGGPYSVTARRIGSPVKTKPGLYLSLGQFLQVDVRFDEQVLLQGVETRAALDRQFSRAHQGAETFLGDSVIHEIPVINRDLYDLVRLVPQMSTWSALTASGAGPRVNSIQIDGVTDQVPSSNLAAGQLYGGKVIPLDAVKEYEVLFSPFDVRHGGFAGASVNVVTRSGTNELHGTVFGFGTNSGLGANVPLVRNARYDKEQYGFSLGGPIVHDHLLFFVSSELQRRMIPATGASLGETLPSDSSLPVSAADIARFQRLLSARGLDGGSAGPITNPNPSSSIFLRLDAPIRPWNSRVTVRGTYGAADSAIFARPTMLAPTDCPTSACFPLSSLQHSRWVMKRSLGAQLHSNFGSGADNELVVGYSRLVSGFRPTVEEPLILVSVAAPSGAPVVLQSGTHEIATGQRNASSTTEVTDNLSISAGAHRLTVGATTQLFALRAFQLRGSYGVWEFSSLDSLQAGAASHYRVTRDTGSVTAASGAYTAVYLGDEWEASSRLSLTLGVRADVPALSARPPYVAPVDSVFHLRSDKVPSGAIQWSPRFGFNYDLTRNADAPAQVRGGLGLFTGRVPLFWLFGGFAAYGLAARTLQCGSLPGDAGSPPAFRGDARNPPLACAGGQTFGGPTTGEVDVIDSRLRLPQTMRGSLAMDGQLPLGIRGTIEGLYTRATRSLFFSPVNLSGPIASDSHGRVMYGTVGTTGVAIPSRVASSLGDVIHITNQSKDYAYDVTGELRKESRIADVAAALSVGRTRDVESPRTVSALLTDNWRFARPLIGRQDDRTAGTSDFDQPLRLRTSGTIHSPWGRFRTDLSFFYIGGKGIPYTYVAGGTLGHGDLNADGAVGNDPIYIPHTAFDTTEIKFAGSAAQVAAQQTAFERFVNDAACLREQRGRIMSRNSCRSPWMSQTNLAIRQGIPSIGAQAMVLEMQVFNVLNLLNSRWGRMALPTGATPAITSQVPLLSQVGESAGPGAQPIYRFDPTTTRYGYDNFDSYYQIQFAVRYTF